MSTTLPFHFHSTAFTSTLQHSLFNVWLVLLTAIFFFLVLSWYNFFLSAYYYVTDNTAFLSPDTECKQYTLRNQMIGTFFFALFWTFVAVLIYYILNNLGWLNVSKETANYWQEHPVLRDEARLSTIK